MIKILMNADVDGVVGGINVWSKHLVNYYEAINPDDIVLNTISDKRKDFTSFADNKFLRIVDGVRVYFFFILKVIKELSRNDYSILHITTSASYGLLRDYFLLMIANRREVKTVIHFHFGRIPDLKIKQNWEWKLLLKVCKLANTVIVLDQNSLEALLDTGIKTVRKVPNPLSLQLLNDIKLESVINRNTNEVLYVGQCYKEKGIYELVEACRQIPNIKLKIVGSISPDIKKELEKKAQDMKIEISGIKPYQEVIQDMKKCGIFVLPSYSEGFPNVILEAMACSCSIVCTDVGAIPEMLDVENGFNNGICVKPRDVEGLKNAILKILNDRDYAKMCGENAQKRVNVLYSMPNVWKQLVNIWKSV